MKHVALILAFSLSFSVLPAFGQEDGLQTNGLSNAAPANLDTNQAANSKIPDATPEAHNDFYVTQPWVPPYDGTLSDLKHVWHNLEELPGDLTSDAKGTLKVLAQDYVVGPLKEGKRLVKRFFDISSPEEIYHQTKLLPDDVLVVSVKSVPLKIDLPPQTGPYTAMLQLKIKRASGKQFYGLRTRPIGVANTVRIINTEATDDQPAGKYLSGPEVTSLVNLPGHKVFNEDHRLVFELKGADLYGALKSLRFNYGKHDQYSFAVALIANQKNRYIYDTFEIPLRDQDISFATLKRGIGNGEPTVAAVHLKELIDLNFKADQTSTTKLYEEISRQQNATAQLQEDFSKRLTQIEEQLNAMAEQYAALDTAALNLQQLINDSGMADEKLCKRFEELQSNLQELKDRMVTLQSILLTAHSISPIPPEDDEE